MIGTAKTKAIHSIVFYQLSGPRGVKNALSTQQLLVLFIYNRKISKIEDTVRFTGFYDHEPRAGYLGEGGGGLHTRWRSHRDRCLVHITTHPEWRQDSKTYGLLQEPMTGLRGIYTHFSISQRYKKKLLTPAHYALSSGLRELKLVFIRAINNLEVLF